MYKEFSSETTVAKNTCMQTSHKFIKYLHASHKWFCDAQCSFRCYKLQKSPPTRMYVIKVSLSSHCHFYAYESCQSVAIKLKNTNEIRNVSVHKNVAFFIVPWQ